MVWFLFCQFSLSEHKKVITFGNESGIPSIFKHLLNLIYYSSSIRNYLLTGKRLNQNLFSSDFYVGQT